MLHYSPLGARGPRTGDGSELQIELIRIANTDRKGWRAYIRTGGRRKGWYSVGEKFETFELMSIDEDTKCIDIYAENIREKKTYCIE